MAHADLARLLQERLGLDLPPVALALVTEPPAGLATDDRPAPSACTFWRRAERGVFYASAEDHMGCAIGAMVMGFELSEEKVQELMGLVGQMCSICYIEEKEVPHIPRFTSAPRGVVYGPLADFPLPPDTVVVWATPGQAMLLQEAVGALQWADSPSGALFGRPACAALPTSLNRGQATLSLGCMGMRTFTEIPADRCLVAIPGFRLATLAEDLERTASANDQMEQFYRGHKAQYQTT